MPSIRIKLSDPSKPYRDQNPLYAVRGNAVIEVPGGIKIPPGIRSAIGGGKLLVTDEEPHENTLSFMDVMPKREPTKARWDTEGRWDSHKATATAHLTREAERGEDAAPATKPKRAKPAAPAAPVDTESLSFENDGFVVHV